MGGRRSRHLAIIRETRAELQVAEDATVAAARNDLVVGGAAARQAWMRCVHREWAVRAALAAMEDFGLGE